VWLGVGYPNDPIDGGPLGIYFPCELPPCESPSWLPYSGWWVEPLGTWVGRLVLTCSMAGIGVITRYWTYCLSLLVIGWTIIRKKIQ